VPIEETPHRWTDWRGQVEVGNSNFSGEQIDEAESVSERQGLARFVSAQNHFNLLHREPLQDVVPACVRDGLGVLPYFPLASGLLTGKYKRGAPAPEGTRLSQLPEERAACHVGPELRSGGALRVRGSRVTRSRARLRGWPPSRPASSSPGRRRPSRWPPTSNGGRRLSDSDLAELDQLLGAAGEPETVVGAIDPDTGW
jgi:hypothetical protein